MFDQHVQQNSLASIVPDLAAESAWNEEGTARTLSLRQGVKWHDGKPLTGERCAMHPGPVGQHDQHGRQTSASRG